MSEDDLPPLDDDVRQLVERTRREPVPSPGAQARVFAALEGVVGPLGGGGGASSSGTTGGAGSPARAAPRATGGSAGRFVSHAASFLLGGAVCALAMRAASHPVAPAPMAMAPPAPAVASEAPSAIPPQPATNPGAAPTVVFSAPRQQGAAPDSLAAERAILDGARHALEREDGEAALAATADHQRRFPNGFLVQEREVMTVRALAMLGRTAEARRRAARFRARYPDSLLLPALESTLGRSP